jgi:pyruvate dehydrogenase E2 component (dihydrolipoamide acetyltransferase)
MAELITMPKLGFDMAEGKLEEWAKQAGDTVAEGDVLAIIETDKASVEVTSFHSGVLHELLVAAGDIVPIGKPIAVIGAAGETIDLAALGLETAPAAPAGPPKPAAAAKQPQPAAAAGPLLPAETPAAAPVPTGRLLASPVAVRMAGELGIDLSAVRGSGPEGRIIKRDIEAYLREREKAPAKPAAMPVPVPAMAPSLEGIEGYHAEPLTAIRKTIARRMVESKQQAPHFYITVSVDMGAAMALRKQLNAVLPEESKISVNDLVVKAAAVALRMHPALNASYAGDEIRYHDAVNIGMAVARDTGLLTVVIKDCDKKSLAQIGHDAREVVNRAREGRMQLDDMTGGTFTVSNLGMFDVEHFVAIINPPQAAILAVGAVQQVPVVDANGQLAAGTRMKATLSADHRVTDGAVAAQFMQVFRKALEEPMRLVV